ncbi:MAG: negative regulator of flagellin synthesis FlgM [Candidatus Azotimanducaceae bacterium]|jgi:negative regulator of flagellin synthesis FlgM
MNIDINSGGVGKGISVDSNNRPQANASKEAPVTVKPGTQSTDKVTMTEQAAKLQKLDEMVRASPDVDQAKVDRIKQQIAEGKFQIDAESIANSIIQQEKELSR